MKDFNIAIFGCGTVGSGVARILTEFDKTLSQRCGHNINLRNIVEIERKYTSEKYKIPLELFCGKGDTISKEEANKYIQEIINDPSIDLVIETIGGSNDFIEKLCVDILNGGKHLVTANKALLAERGVTIYEAAEKNNKIIGFEAAVCGAIPIIKTIRESFTGDEIISLSGIMNGTSNYILTKMYNENMDFISALKLAQEKGYAEADPALDINGGDAGHKLVILLKLVFGIDLKMEQLSISGIQHIAKDDIEFAREIDCRIKLICFAQRIDGEIYATVCPMMVKNENLLSDINGATNAVKVVNRYAGKHILIGAGAGSTETASSIVADIVFIARYAEKMEHHFTKENLKFIDARHFKFPYIITFETEDEPGITGLVTTAIGEQKINIDTVSHNVHKSDKAIFSVATMPCTLQQIENVIANIKTKNSHVLLSEPKVIPILY